MVRLKPGPPDPLSKIYPWKVYCPAGKGELKMVVGGGAEGKRGLPKAEANPMLFTRVKGGGFVFPLLNGMGIADVPSAKGCTAIS